MVSFKTLDVKFALAPEERFARVADIFDRFWSDNYGRVTALNTILDGLHSDLSALTFQGTVDSAVVAFFQNLTKVNYSHGAIWLSFAFREQAEFALRRIVALVHSLGGTEVEATLTDDATGLSTRLR